MNEINNNQDIQLLAIIVTLIGAIPLSISFVKFSISFVKYCIKWYRKKIKLRIKRHQLEYYNELDSDKYIQWRNLQLSKLYGDNYLTNVLGTLYPIFEIKFAEYFKYSDFKDKQVYSKDDIKEKDYSFKNGEIEFRPFEKEEIMTSGTKKEIKQKKKLLKEYKKILTGSVKTPKLTGFSLDHYDFNQDGRITHIYPKLGTYEYNVFSSHILEYELFKAYKHLGGKPDVPIETLWKYLPFRHQIHEGKDVKDILFSGIRRYSLFSVQCLVLFKDSNYNEYMTLLMRRSTDPNKIASKLGYYQFLPAGGFDIYEKEQSHSMETIKDNYSLRKAVFREYLEEVFDEKDFKMVEPTDNSETTDRILNHPRIIEIINLIENGKASLNLLGVAVDLVSLRHEISFILKINDDDYSHKDFCPNDEFTKNNSVSSKVRVSLKKVESLLKTTGSNHSESPKFNQASALLYKMFMESPFYPQS